MPAGSSYWVEEGMLNKKIYNAAANGDGKVDYVCFPVTNKFLHPNHPIGWVRKMEVYIDGQHIDTDDICFVLRDQWIPLKYMPTIRDIWWHMLEEGWIYIKSDALPSGSTHSVNCNIDISLLVHTENLDRTGIFPCLHCSLTEEMTVQEEVRA